MNAKEFQDFGFLPFQVTGNPTSQYQDKQLEASDAREKVIDKDTF